MALLQISEPGQSTAPHHHNLACGIDLGTTNSLVASVISGETQLILDKDNEAMLPSVVHCGQSKLTIGIGSTALYVSFLLGIKTISYIPNRYKLPIIPLPQKYNLTNLEDLSSIDFSNAIRENINSGALPFHQMLNYFLRREN